ncbi:outer membrane protein [Bradyrhizobium arachidis]|uniref:Porin family protein n=1 Tax=Bradyrhizobium arachidis TaxID=858423 RepID=A0AAE7NV17_9BRAD|nr:outer membrane beta-barrel protein [Bradyrhizobium arachidis]QOZ71717.1 porin family protein [Bradyrhizobium arachidis]SFV19157.1 outer membrane immunogenic protein [Bradyrhizobium arachidis]
MKKLFAVAAGAGALALGLSAPASAADLAARPYTKAPPPMVATIYDWSGFYIGVNGGYGSSHTCADVVAVGVVPVVPAAAEGCHNATGGTAGGQIGYRWQSANWVFGVEGQGNWADFTGSNIGLFTGADNRSRIDSFGLITGQVGYAWNNVLLYVKGGAAVVGDRFDSYVPPGFVGAGTLLASARDTRWGATVGAGIEFGFAPNWSVGFEYDHIFLGHHDTVFTTPAAGVFGTARIGQDVDMGLVRVNYRWGGPVVAKY